MSYIYIHLFPYINTHVVSLASYFSCQEWRSWCFFTFLSHGCYSCCSICVCRFWPQPPRLLLLLRFQVFLKLLSGLARWVTIMGLVNTTENQIFIWLVTGLMWICHLIKQPVSELVCCVCLYAQIKSVHMHVFIFWCLDFIVAMFVGAGLASDDKFYYGFFSAAMKLPAGYTSGVVVAFYVITFSSKMLTYAMLCYT